MPNFLAELPSFIGGSAYNTSSFAFLGIGSDYYRFIFQFWMLSNLHRGKEGIEINVQDKLAFQFITLACIIYGYCACDEIEMRRYYHTKGSKR